MKRATPIAAATAAAATTATTTATATSHNRCKFALYSDLECCRSMHISQQELLCWTSQMSQLQSKNSFCAIINLLAFLPGDPFISNAYSMGSKFTDTRQ